MFAALICSATERSSARVVGAAGDPGFLEDALVEIQNRVRDPESSREESVVVRVEGLDRGDQVVEELRRIGVGVDAVLGGDDGLGVDEELGVGVLSGHDLGKGLGPAETGLELLELFVVGALVRHVDDDLVLRGVVVGGHVLEGLSGETLEGVPHVDIDRTRRPLERCGVAQRRVSRGSSVGGLVSGPAAGGHHGQGCGDRHHVLPTLSQLHDHVSLWAYRWNHRHHHPLTAPAVRPRMSCLWKTMSTMMSGTAERAAAAKPKFSSLISRFSRVRSATWMVWYRC